MYQQIGVFEAKLLSRRGSQVGLSRRCASMQARPSLRPAQTDCFRALPFAMKELVRLAPFCPTDTLEYTWP